jgi:hypothetical protein
LLGTHVEARCVLVMRVDDQDVFLLEKSGEGQLRDSPEVRHGSISQVVAVAPIIECHRAAAETLLSGRSLGAGHDLTKLVKTVVCTAELHRCPITAKSCQIVAQKI